MLITQTPLRISLFGGGTDFPAYFAKFGGCALSMAINKYIYVVINTRIDRRVRVSCTHIQTVSHVKNLHHELIREAMNIVGIDHGVDIYIIGDIPAGTGLGSSSSVTVGLLKAMHTFRNNDISAEDLAQEACKIEVDILKKPIGVQDQHIAAHGGFRLFDFGPDKLKVGESNEEVARALNERIMLFFTGVTRRADDILSEQKRNISDNISSLHRIKELTHKATEELSAGNYDAIGGLLNESWQLKKSLASGITSKRVDELYDRAIRAGALGGKITGAGGGGFLMIYSPLEKKESVRKALRSLREVPFSFESSGSKVVYDKG